MREIIHWKEISHVPPGLLQRLTHHNIWQSTTLTITNCPCTVTKPVYTVPVLYVPPGLLWTGLNEFIANWEIANRLHTSRPRLCSPPRLLPSPAAHRFLTRAVSPYHTLARKWSIQAASQLLAPEPLLYPSRFPPALFRYQLAPLRSLPAPSKSQQVLSRSQHRVAQYPPSQFIAIPPRLLSHHQPVLQQVVLPVVLPEQLRPANHSLVLPTRRILHQVPALLLCLVLPLSCYRWTYSWSLADLAFHTGVLHTCFYPLTIINIQWPWIHERRIPWGG